MLDQENSIYKNIENTSYFMFGGTIGNFTFDERVQILKNMRPNGILNHNNIFQNQVNYD